MSYDCVDGYADLTSAFESAGLVALEDREDNQADEVARCVAALQKLTAERAQLRDALRLCARSLENWVEIQDREDAREYDQDALEAARVALDWEPPQRRGQDYARAGLGALCRARQMFELAKAPKTLARVRLAISSAKGAVRAAGYRETRQYVERRNMEGTA